MRLQPGGNKADFRDDRKCVLWCILFIGVVLGKVCLFPLTRDPIFNETLRNILYVKNRNSTIFVVLK